ncbi:MAG: DinB family protein [Bacteroidia bacterium]|nr:DinB family protein [Bacteroidia bacterium]
MKEAELLAEMLDHTRQLTRFYLKHTADIDLQKRFEIGDFQTNSVHWIVAHLSWAEWALTLKALGSDVSPAPWFTLFKIGAPAPDPGQFPPYEEVRRVFDETHATALAHIRSLEDATLKEENELGMSFGGGKEKRMIIQHCIRHEGTHTGHLGWILRMSGKKVI